MQPTGSGRDIQLLDGLILIVGTSDLVISGLFPIYAGFGLASEAMNQLTCGFNEIRSGFTVTTLLLAYYLIWQRASFIDEPMLENRLKWSSQDRL
jgi:hypothetical protein